MVYCCTFCGTVIVTLFIGVIYGNEAEENSAVVVQINPFIAKYKKIIENRKNRSKRDDKVLDKYSVFLEFPESFFSNEKLKALYSSLVGDNEAERKNGTQTEATKLVFKLEPHKTSGEVTTERKNKEKVTNVIRSLMGLEGVTSKEELKNNSEVRPSIIFRQYVVDVFSTTYFPTVKASLMTPTVIGGRKVREVRGPAKKFFESNIPASCPPFCPPKCNPWPSDPSTNDTCSGGQSTTKKPYACINPCPCPERCPCAEPCCNPPPQSTPLSTASATPPPTSPPTPPRTSPPTLPSTSPSTLVSTSLSTSPRTSPPKPPGTSPPTPPRTPLPTAPCGALHTIMSSLCPLFPTTPSCGYLRTVPTPSFETPTNSKTTTEKQNSSGVVLPRKHVKNQKSLTFESLRSKLNSNSYLNGPDQVSNEKIEDNQNSSSIGGSSTCFPCPPCCAGPHLRPGSFQCPFICCPLTTLPVLQVLPGPTIPSPTPESIEASAPPVEPINDSHIWKPLLSRGSPKKYVSSYNNNIKSCSTQGPFWPNLQYSAYDNVQTDDTSSCNKMPITCIPCCGGSCPRPCVPGIIPRGNTCQPLYMTPPPTAVPQIYCHNAMDSGVGVPARASSPNPKQREEENWRNFPIPMVWRLFKPKIPATMVKNTSKNNTMVINRLVLENGPNEANNSFERAEDPNQNIKKFIWKKLHFSELGVYKDVEDLKNRAKFFGSGITPLVDSGSSPSCRQLEPLRCPGPGPGLYPVPDVAVPAPPYDDFTDSPPEYCTTTLPSVHKEVLEEPAKTLLKFLRRKRLNRKFM